ncbi:hypothetical protein ACQ4PT_025990 [Festuca glaucescens]
MDHNIALYRAQIGLPPIHAGQYSARWDMGSPAGFSPYSPAMFQENYGHITPRMRFSSPSPDDEGYAAHDGFDPNLNFPSCPRDPPIASVFDPSFAASPSLRRGPLPFGSSMGASSSYQGAIGADAASVFAGMPGDSVMHDIIALKWAGLLPFARLVDATRSEVIGERGGTLIKCLQYDHSLLTCLVDRWRPETHTFHFRWGEMAPTLQDVSFLLGLPLEGQAIGPLEEPADWDDEMALRFQETREGQPDFLYEDHGPKCDWLLNFEVAHFSEPMTEPQITRSLEAYLMWLLGKVMFTENHQTTISRRYIPIALEIAEATSADDITPRSWGSAVLAATYRDIDGDSSFGIHELDDADRIDMPTFGILWTRRPRRFARDQVRNCYPAFTEQFDVLDDRAMIWEPYTTVAMHARYPGGISILCYRDCAYWMTQLKIIFDVSVEVMSQQGIMRQFASRQLVDPPPAIVPLPDYVHKYNRKGTSHSAQWWLQRLATFVADGDGATTRIWTHHEQFDPQEFDAYLRRYMTATRVRIIPTSDSAEAPPATMQDMYPTQFTAGSRQHAVHTFLFHQHTCHLHIGFYVLNTDFAGSDDSRTTG